MLRRPSKRRWRDAGHRRRAHEPLAPVPAKQCHNAGIMTRYTLYGRQGSGSLAIQVALEEIGAPYDRIWITGEAAAAAEFRRVNPTGKVPALVLPDGTVMIESAAMLIHLAIAHPQASLAPAPGTSEHAKFLQWVVFLSANVYEAVLRVYYADRYSSRGVADAEAIRAQGLRDYLAHLTFIGERLSPYLLGPRQCIADVYLYMLASWCPDGLEALGAKIPALGKHAENVARRPSVMKVTADHTGTTDTGATTT